MDENPEGQQVEDPNLRKCAICTKSIPERPYQAKSARACSPGCAKTLAAREHPEDIGPISVRRGEHYWRDRLAQESSEKPPPTGEKT